MNEKAIELASRYNLILLAELDSQQEELEYQAKIGAQQFEVQRVEIEQLKTDLAELERSYKKVNDDFNTLYKSDLLLKQRIGELTKNRDYWLTESKKRANRINELEEEIKLLCSAEPCPKCGYGVTGECYGCEIKRLKNALETLIGSNWEFDYNEEKKKRY